MDGSICEVLVPVALGEEGLPKLFLLHVKVDEGWIVKFLHIGPYVIPPDDAPDCLQLAYCVIHAAADTVPRGHIQAPNRVLLLFSAEIVGFSTHRVPQLNVVGVLVPSEHVSSAPLGVSDAQADIGLEFIYSTLVLVDEVEIVA